MFVTEREGLRVTGDGRHYISLSKCLFCQDLSCLTIRSKNDNIHYFPLSKKTDLFFTKQTIKRSAAGFIAIFSLSFSMRRDIVVMTTTFDHHQERGLSCPFWDSFPVSSRRRRRARLPIGRR